VGSNPTLSAIFPLLNSPSLRILWRPEEAWDAVRIAAPSWRRTLFGLAAPLALLPAIAWPLGHAVDPIGPDVAAARSLAASFGATFLLCLLAVLVAAAAIYALAPVFSTARHWDRAMAVAVYSAIPVFLASPLLASAVLTILVIAALFHAFFLCSIGLRRLLGCRSEDAAMYVAAAGFVAGFVGIVLGGLSSAVGIL
jgi:hypothetical protein